jgi:hypothetical protein
MPTTMIMTILAFTTLGNMTRIIKGPVAQVSKANTTTEPVMEGKGTYVMDHVYYGLERE